MRKEMTVLCSLALAGASGTALAGGSDNSPDIEGCHRYDVVRLRNQSGAHAWYVCGDSTDEKDLPGVNTTKYCCGSAAFSVSAGGKWQGDDGDPSSWFRGHAHCRRRDGSRPYTSYIVTGVAGSISVKVECSYSRENDTRARGRETCVGYSDAERFGQEDVRYSCTKRGANKT